MRQFNKHLDKKIVEMEGYKDLSDNDKIKLYDKWLDYTWGDVSEKELLDFADKIING